MLAEVARAQAETMDRYEAIEHELAKTTDGTTRDDQEKLNAKLFAQKFVFFVQFDANEEKYTTSEKYIEPKRKLFLIVLDFYLNSAQRHFLK